MYKSNSIPFQIFDIFMFNERKMKNLQKSIENNLL